MIKSKKLSSLVAASLILAGGSFLGVQTVSADDATRLAAVEALASQNHSSISELTEKVNNISTTPEQLQQIDTNKDNITKNQTAIQTNADAIKKNSDAITANKTAADTAIQANTESITKIQDDLKAANLDEMSKTAASLKNYDTQMSTVQALAAGNKDNIDKNKTAIDQNKSDIATNK
uniref:hypothetical protein n=1 Tax=Dialister succinatiphilus TaxID=487173 RepID=UPI004025473B